MDDIVYSSNPNDDSVQASIEGKYHKASLVRSIGNAEVIYQDNPNVGKVLFTGSDGKKHTATLVMDIGGGDQHNLGWYATQSALETAYPTATAGDYAIVGATDTVWIWDTDTSAWVDSDQKGQVTSVNGQTGAVTLGINDVAPTQTGKSGYVLGTDGFVADWVKPEIVQRSALPQASEEEVGKIYQYIGTTDANYTNGYFYKCVSDGQNPATYSWEQTDVQPAGNSYTAGTGIDITNGTVSVEHPNVVQGDTIFVEGEKASGSTGYNSVVVGVRSKTRDNCVVIGCQAGSAGVGPNSVIIGNNARATANKDGGIAIGSSASSYGNYGVAIGSGASSGADNAIQIGRGVYPTTTNSDANTFKVANANGNFEIMSADGTIPEARLADTTNATAGQALVLDSQGNAVWSDISSSPTTAPTLVAANWSSNQQTVNVSGVTATNTVIVAPIPTDAQDYATAGILCIGQGAGTLTFSCTSVPASDLQVNVVII